MRLIIFSFTLLALSFPFSVEAGRRVNKRIAVPGALRVELNSVLKATDSLHSACSEQSESKIAASLRDVINSIERAQNKSSLAKSDRSHLLKILNAAHTELEMSQMQSGKIRKVSLKKAFNNLVQIAQIFKLDKYRVFFCPQDRSIWLQKSRKAKNPINPSRLKNCGRLVQ